jgi:hypothetical protein
MPTGRITRAWYLALSRSRRSVRLPAPISPSPEHLLQSAKGSPSPSMQSQATVRVRVDLLVADLVVPVRQPQEQPHVAVVVAWGEAVLVVVQLDEVALELLGDLGGAHRSTSRFAICSTA